MKGFINKFFQTSFKQLASRSANISLYFLASIAQVVVGLVLSPILAVHLKHRDFAIVGYFNSFNLLFVPVVGFTFASYYSKTYFRIGAEQRRRLRETLVSAQLGLGSIALLIVLGLFWLYSNIYDSGFSFYPYAFLAYGGMVFSNIYSFYLVDLRLSKRAKNFLSVSMAHHALYITAMITFCAILKYGAAGSLFATTLVSIAMGVYCYRKMVRKFRVDKQILLDAFSFCWPLILAGCVHYFSSGVDKAMLAGIKDDYNMGLYSVAMRFASYIHMFYHAVTMTIEPDIYQSIAQKRYKRLLYVILGLFAINAAIVAVFVLFTPLILQVLTAGRYTEADTLTRIISLRNITASLFFITAIIINALGYSKVTLVNRILSAVLVTAMFRWLISKYTFTGAAWGQVLSYVLMTIFSLLFVGYKFLRRKKQILEASNVREG